MPREPARNKKPRKEPTNFVARFRFSGQISNRATFFLPKMRFSHLFHTPEPAFPTLSRDYGGVRCSTIPKTAEKWNRVTFTECRTCRNRRNHVTMARETHSRLHFSYISTTRASLSGIGTKSPGNITISYMSAKNN